MNLDPSAEVNAMASADRKKWLTVAEGQRIRKEWDKTREAMDKCIAKFDEDSENESEALMLVLLGGLTVDAFMRQCVEASGRLKELMGDGR
jgi:hypothetical protein